jgi:hypothetical protein
MDVSIWVKRAYVFSCMCMAGTAGLYLALGLMVGVSMAWMLVYILQFLFQAIHAILWMSGSSFYLVTVVLLLLSARDLSLSMATGIVHWKRPSLILLMCFFPCAESVCQHCFGNVEGCSGTSATCPLITGLATNVTALASIATATFTVAKLLPS